MGLIYGKYLYKPSPDVIKTMCYESLKYNILRITYKLGDKNNNIKYKVLNTNMTHENSINYVIKNIQNKNISTSHDYYYDKIFLYQTKLGIIESYKDEVKIFGHQIFENNMFCNFNLKKLLTLRVL